MGKIKYYKRYNVIVYDSERGVGIGVKKAIDEGIVKREDLFITTKLTKYNIKDPESAIKNSLKMLGLKYVDLYLLHWPKYFDYSGKNRKTNNVPLHVLWPILENLVKKDIQNILVYQILIFRVY